MSKLESFYGTFYSDLEIEPDYNQPLWIGVYRRSGQILSNWRLGDYDYHDIDQYLEVGKLGENSIVEFTYSKVDDQPLVFPKSPHQIDLSPVQLIQEVDRREMRIFTDDELLIYLEMLKL